MQLLWFGIAAALLTIYTVLDGFDFGAGGLHLVVARGDEERRTVLAAIGPFWDGNEVWLIASGGVLFLAFPRVLGSGLSGLYLAVMILLWVLILRGIAIEFRSHLEDPMWRSFFDAVFGGASLLAPTLLGAVLGNLVRGVPLDAEGWFALPLFASFSPRGALGIFDWYTLLVALFALFAILHHGALFLVWKTDGPVRERSRRWASGLFAVTVAGWIATVGATWSVAPELLSSVPRRPVALVATLVAIAGLASTLPARRAGRELHAFLGSCGFLLGLLAAIASALYPTMLKAAGDASLSLTALDASAGEASLRRALLWWPLGFALAVTYLALLFRFHSGKVRPSDEGY